MVSDAMSDNKLKKVRVFIASYVPGFKAGGPIKSLSNLIAATGDEYSFDIFTSDRDLGMEQPYVGVGLNRPVKVGQATVFYCSKNLKGLVFLFRTLLSSNGPLYYFSSFFSFKFSVLPFLTVSAISPEALRVVAPRGEFSVGALSIKPIKKKVFISVVKLLGLYKSAVWHASSDKEASDIKAIFGLNANVRIATDLASSDVSKIRYRVKTEASVEVIFLSRICKMKNLLAVGEILARSSCIVALDIYGPIEDAEYWAECEKQFCMLPSRISVTYKGIADPENVVAVISKYDLLILPTLGENFGHVIAESLFAGVPVLISDRTPWMELEDKWLGWSLPLFDLEKFSRCIDCCSAMSDAEYQVWRMHIRDWASANISGNAAIRQSRDLFSVLESM